MNHVQAEVNLQLVQRQKEAMPGVQKKEKRQKLKKWQPCHRHAFAVHENRQTKEEGRNRFTE